MPLTEVSVIIERPVEEVFAFVENPENDPIWRPGVIESGEISRGPKGVGTTGREVYEMLGVRGESTWEITEYEPDRKVSYRSTSGPVTYKGTWTYESVEGGTRVTFAIDWEIAGWDGFGRLSERVVGMTIFQTNDGNLKALKKLLEA